MSKPAEADECLLPVATLRFVQLTLQPSIRPRVKRRPAKNLLQTSECFRAEEECDSRQDDQKTHHN